MKSQTLGLYVKTQIGIIPHISGTVYELYKILTITQFVFIVICIIYRQDYGKLSKIFLSWLNLQKIFT